MSCETDRAPLSPKARVRLALRGLLNWLGGLWFVAAATLLIVLDVDLLTQGMNGSVLVENALFSLVLLAFIFGLEAAGAGLFLVGAIAFRDAWRGSLTPLPPVHYQDAERSLSWFDPYSYWH